VQALLMNSMGHGRVRGAAGAHGPKKVENHWSVHVNVNVN